MKTIIITLILSLICSVSFAECTWDMPAARKPWIASGQTACDWAGYECTNFEDCLKCNVAVANCEI